ncbi:MAG: DUF3224 domain-containing protein [Acidimicrobiales bacterium]
MAQATGSFEVASWDEEPYEELDGGGKLTRATVTLNLSGDIEGDGSVVWLMCYRPDGTAHFVGLLRVTGAVGGHKGTVVLDTTGDYEGSEAVAEWSIVPGSGTDELAGLIGRGTGRAPSQGPASFELEYGLA